MAKIFISLSFAAPLAISGNCRRVFGPHFPSFIVCSHQSFLCLFGHGNRLVSVLVETGKTQYAASHTAEERVCCVKILVKSLTVRRLWFFRGSRCQHPGRNTANVAGFHQRAKGSITVELHHSATDSDFTDIYWNKNLWDYIFNSSY